MFTFRYYIDLHTWRYYIDLHTWKVLIFWDGNGLCVMLQLDVGDKVRCLVEGRRYGQIGTVKNIVEGAVFVDFDGQQAHKQSRYAVFYVPIVELERVQDA